MTNKYGNSAEEQLREALRLSKIMQGLPVEDRPLTCPLDDEDSNKEHVEAIAQAVVDKLSEMFLRESGRLVWDGIRKLVITGALALLAVQQVAGWLR